MKEGEQLSVEEVAEEIRNSDDPALEFFKVYKKYQKRTFYYDVFIKLQRNMIAIIVDGLRIKIKYLKSHPEELSNFQLLQNCLQFAEKYFLYYSWKRTVNSFVRKQSVVIKRYIDKRLGKNQLEKYNKQGENQKNYYKDLFSNSKTTNPNKQCKTLLGIIISQIVNLFLSIIVVKIIFRCRKNDKRRRVRV